MYEPLVFPFLLFFVLLLCLVVAFCSQTTFCCPPFLFLSHTLMKLITKSGPTLTLCAKQKINKLLDSASVSLVLSVERLTSMSESDSHCGLTVLSWGWGGGVMAEWRNSGYPLRTSRTSLQC